MDAQEKDDVFRNPELTNMHFGRHISTACIDNRLWLALQMEHENSISVLVAHRDNGEGFSFIHGPDGLPHQPVIIEGPDGNPFVVWNEATDAGWEIRCSGIDIAGERFGDIETVFASERLILPPTATSYGGNLWIAWAGIDGDRVRIHVADNVSGSWCVSRLVQDSHCDCFRPCLASTQDSVYLVHDRYCSESYEIVMASLDNGTWNEIDSRGEENERWMCPRALGASDGSVWLTWVVLKEVVDKLGIIDHFAFAVVALYREGNLQIVADNSNPTDLRIIADFREGLLASEIYKGHVGLRRNPHLSLQQNGNPWLFWEQRPETKGSDVTARFTGREYLGENKWTEPQEFHGQGYCYSVAEGFKQDIPISFLTFEAEGLDVISSEFIDSASGRDVTINHDKWDRWECRAVRPESKPQQKIILPDGEYSLYWADTHCHSNFSPDAEGEIDELVHFGRDYAGLDVISIIDNDYYPHKALTEPEWRIHGEFSRHFTKTNEFAFLPGYEFTYHRSDLNPDFNHRCVIYPRPGGKLLRRIDPDSDTDCKMIRQLRQTNGMAYPHHCSYKLIDESVEWNIEACSSWRVCLEETIFTMEQLKSGARIGFVGSSDTHRAVPGLGGALTGLYVKELTPEALFDAYRNRRCIATQGFSIFVDFRVEEAFIGEQLITAKDPALCANIVANDSIDSIEIIRDGEVIRRESGNGGEHRIEFSDVGLQAGEHFYVLKIKLCGDPSLNVTTDPKENFPIPFSQDSRYPHNLARACGVFAWSSPVWVRKQ